MNYREQLLAEIITETLAIRGKESNVIEFVVFTNNCIGLRNKREELKICFIGEMLYLIDDYEGTEIYTEDDITALAEVISDSAESNEYEFEMDMQKFKEDFVRVLVTLENYEEQQEVEEMTKQKNTTEIPYFLTKEYAEKQRRNKSILYAVVGLASVAGMGVVIAKELSKARK